MSINRYRIHPGYSGVFESSKISANILPSKKAFYILHRIRMSGGRLEGPPERTPTDLCLPLVIRKRYK